MAECVVAAADAAATTAILGLRACAAFLTHNSSREQVDDVFGPVTEPHYSIRLPADFELPPTLAPGSRVFSVRSMSSYLRTDVRSG